MLILLRRIVFTVIKVWSLPVQQWFEASILAKWRREEILGFEVYMQPQSEEVPPVSIQVREALLLLPRTDRRRFSRIQRDITRFVIAPVTNVSGAHFPKSFIS